METKSLIVPSVQEIVKEPLTKVPERYVRPHHDRPILSTITPLPQLPVIDLSILLSQDLNLKGLELHKLHSACKQWGFFQVTTNLFFPIIYIRVINC
jgi:hypothetical protein